MICSLSAGCYVIYYLISRGIVKELKVREFFTKKIQILNFTFILKHYIVEDDAWPP